MRATSPVAWASLPTHEERLPGWWDRVVRHRDVRRNPMSTGKYLTEWVQADGALKVVEVGLSPRGVVY
jgi:hypothetical protein